VEVWKDGQKKRVIQNMFYYFNRTVLNPIENFLEFHNYGGKMAKISVKFIIVLACNFSILLPSHPLFAQRIKTLTLKSCIESALKYHPSLQTFENREESKLATTRSMVAQTHPGIEFSLQGTSYQYHTYHYQTLENRLNLVWDMGKWRGKLQELGVTEEDIARLQSKQNQLKLTCQVKQAYFAIIAARQEIQIAHLSETYLKHHMAISQKLFKLGQIDQLNLFFTQLELASVQEKILEAESKRDEWQIQLSSVTGIAVSLGDSLTSPDTLFLSRRASVDSLISEAHHHNPTIFILDKHIQLAKLQKRMVQNSYLPKIYFGGGYVIDNDPTSEKNYKTLSGGFQFPIFDSGMRKNQARAYHFQTESFESTRSAFLLELGAELGKLATQMNYFRNLVQLKNKTIEQAHRTYDYTEASYQSGIATNTDVLLAQKSLIEAKVSRERVILTLREIQSKIEVLIGNGGVW